MAILLTWRLFATTVALSCVSKGLCEYSPCGLAVHRSLLKINLLVKTKCGSIVAHQPKGEEYSSSSNTQTPCQNTQFIILAAKGPPKANQYNSTSRSWRSPKRTDLSVHSQ